MPANSKNRRVRVNETIRDTAQLDVGTSVSSVARTGTADAAFALASILKGGQPLFQQIDNAVTRQGEADFQTGNVDKNNSSRLYRNAVNRLSARADWVQDEAAIEESLQGLDLDNISQQELDAHIDEQFKGLYGGIELEDQAVAEELIPKLQAFREKTYADVLNRQKANEDAKIGSDLTLIAEDAYGASKAENSEFDYFGLHDQVRSVKQGAESNESYFEIIKDIAIRNGDPDLIRNIPDRWEDGTPSFVSIPSFNEKVLNAELRAAAAQDARENAAAKALEQQQDDTLNAIAIEAINAASDGDLGVGQRLMDIYSQLPGAKASDLLAIEKGLSNLNNNFDKQDIDLQGLAQLSSLVYSGESSLTDILQAWGAGTFGGGKQAADEFQQLLNVQRTIGSESGGTKVTSTAAYRAYLKDIEASYKPDRNNFQFDETLGQILAAARLEFFQEVSRGKSPEEAHNDIREKFDPRAARSPTIGISNAFTPEEAAKTYLDGNMSGFEMKSRGVTLDSIDEMVGLKQITRDQAKQLLNEF